MMRGSEIWREAWRNFSTGAGSILLSALVLLVIVGLGSVFVSSYGSGLARAGTQFRESGASTYVIRANEMVDSQRCVNLQGVGSVQAAGALRESKEIYFAAMPSRAVSTFEATPDFWRLLSANTPGVVFLNQPGVWITDTLARTLGVRPGEEVVLLDGQKLSIAGVFAYPDDGRNRDLGYAVVMPVAVVKDFSQCLIETWPASPEDASLLLSSLKINQSTGAGDEIPTPQQLNTSLGREFNAANSWDTLLRLAVGLSAMAGFVIGFVWIFSRRLVLSSNLHCGIDRITLLLISLAETSIVLIYSLITWLPFGWFAAAFGAAPDALVSFGAGLRTFLAGSGGFVFGVVLGVNRVKESHLFRYFKNR